MADAQSQMSAPNVFPARSMATGVLAGLAAGALWGLVFVAPRMLPGLSAVDFTAGRYAVYGALSLLFMLLMASLAVWYWSAGTISVNTVSTPKIETFYWVAILFSQTLGTALGDWMADTNGLGYEGGALVFAAGLALIAAAYFFTSMSRTGPPSS